MGTENLSAGIGRQARFATACSIRASGSYPRLGLHIIPHTGILEFLLKVEEETETIKKIKTILEEYIRPAVEQDGGAITYHSFQDGVVRVKLQGSCSGCPSSTITLKAGIENLFTRMMPGEVKSVEALS